MSPNIFQQMISYQKLELNVSQGTILEIQKVHLDLQDCVLRLQYMLFGITQKTLFFNSGYSFFLHCTIILFQKKFLQRVQNPWLS